MSSQSELAYQKIKDMIFHMEFMPGDRIAELPLSKQLNISRTPIHNAIKTLEAEGLVVLNENCGAEVKRLSDEEISDIGVMRLSQDILSAQLAGYYGSMSDFESLNRIVDECEQAAKSGDRYKRIWKDMEFHIEIAKIGQNKLLLEQQVKLYQQVCLIQIAKYTNVESSLHQISLHKPLIKAIMNRNMKEITALICQHIKDFFQIDKYIIDQYISMW